jgi:Domain of Unknown Function (DUF1080)
MLKNTSFFKRRIAYCYLIGAISCSPLVSYAQAIITTLGTPIPLFNGADLGAFDHNKDRNGNANWLVINNEIQATQGHSLLVSRLSVPDFQLDFDYWVTDSTQISVFFRCANPDAVNTDTAYEVTLVNQAKGVGAGSILLLNKVKPSKVANQWNHIRISAIGTDLAVTLNGVTHHVQNARFSNGPLAINYINGELRLKNIYLTIPGRW